MNLHKDAKRVHVLDALYGPIAFGEELSALMRAPVVQRMRHIRLSNIDSLALPGISGLSRFEHVLGTAHLSTIVGYSASLNPKQRVALQASALMHDWAITAFGHLVEEAFAYRGSTFNHEGKLQELISSPSSSDIGGVSRQVLGGRETGIQNWCTQVFGGEAEQYLKLITESISGEGPMGPVIAGEIDLDNIDNLHRIAFHMGLDIDKEAPVRLARSLLGATPSGAPIFVQGARDDLARWVELRRDVYTHLMLAQPDFTTKLMLVYATVQAMHAEEFTDQDWNMTDVDFISRLLMSKVKETRDTAERWMTGEFWEMAPLVWLTGPAPEYPRVAAFSHALAKEIKRPLFAYRIKDKRERQLKINFEGATPEVFGRNSTNWLLGVGSPTRRPFTKLEQSATHAFASHFFNVEVVSDSSHGQLQTRDQGSLI